MLQIVKKIYRSLPPWMSAPVRYIPDGLLFGKSFRRCLPRIDTACLGENIKRTLDYTRKHTVWGREVIPEKIVAEEAEGVLSELPTIGSEDLNADGARFVSDEVTRFNSYWSTTGMTKVPTSVCLANSAYGLEWAHMLHIWRLGGYRRRRDCKLTFRGNRFGDGELLRRDPIYNEVSVDSFQVTDKTFRRFLDLVKKERISCIHGYPTLIKMFMDRLVATGEKFPVREIMLASEGASVELKKELADFFGARVLSWYGLTEKVVLAYDEFADGRFVNFTSYGYPRVVNPDANGIGEIVGTTFVNLAMPLVNYRTGDCGRIVRDGERIYIEKLEGRSNKDFIYEAPEIKYSLTAIDVPGEVYRKMLFFQVVQNR
ncbi:MAG: AMP-binding protein, partial [Synergistaceae bacterium]|nr:AMP-binding protein [Synergistaceae bacterium]